MLCNLHFFPSKCRLFHNATLFGFCITHILNTGCAKIWKKKSVAKRLNTIKAWKSRSRTQCPRDRNAWICSRSLAETAGSNPPGRAWMSVSCECCVLWGRGLCDEPIPCREKSYRVYVCVCVIRHNTNSLHLQWVGGRSQTKRGRNKIKDEITKAFKAQWRVDDCIGLRSFWRKTRKIRSLERQSIRWQNNGKFAPALN